jgi:predicted dehydrogenase
MKPVKVGVIGCGQISAAYFNSCKKFGILEVVACADMNPEAAKARAEEFQIPKVLSPEELLADPEIEMVLNLTIPKAHARVSLSALEAGKHVYGEKPLAVTREEGQQILSLARQKRLLVGSAPDTFLGGGIQTCLKLINDGWIGEPVAATAFMIGRGHEHWHANPEFYYEKGGGPMFDMGPYYLTALVQLMGPIRTIAGMTRITFPTRTILSQPKYGKLIPVETPTHVTGTMAFDSGAIATMIMSFDVFGGANVPRIEIFGSEGTISVPDPNTFGGPVRIRRKDEKEFTEVPLTHGYRENSRGVGLADMAYAVRTGRPHRASGELAYHVLEAMHGFHDAALEGKHYEMQSTCVNPAPLPLHLPAYQLDS